MRGSDMLAMFGGGGCARLFSARLLGALCALGMLLLSVSAATAGTLHVPSGRFPTIQSAIDAATNGDTIKVGPGTYLENLTWTAKSIALIGAGADVTIVDGGGLGRCLTMTDVPDTARVEGFTFTGGSAINGGGLYLDNSSPTLTNNDITTNTSTGTAPGGGGGVYLHGSAATLSNNTIAGNSSSFRGGGVCVSENSSATLTNNTIEANTAKYGGGVSLWYATATLASNTITGNSCEQHGGGVYAGYSSLALTNSDITDNSANYGGGVGASRSSVTLTANTITGNSSPWSGGGASVVRSSGTLMDNTISGNATTSYAGGVYIYDCSPTLTGNTIAGNSSTMGGGGLTILSASPTLTGNTITGNSAGRGGAVEIDRASPTLMHNIITGNYAESQGAGLYVCEAAPTIAENTIANNRTPHSGGGLYVSFSSPVLTGNAITGNEAGSGGGLHLSGVRPEATVSGNAIAGNSASFSGGGLYLLRSHPAIADNAITGNSAGTYGGGLWIYDSRPMFVNNTVTENSALTGGGLHLSYESSPTITNDTIGSNTGGGLYNAEDQYPASAPLVTNCILWGNGDYDLGGRPSTATYCDIGVGFVDGEGNISTDPMFLGGGDYHLQSSSPGIDAGDNSAAGLPLTDKDGNPRIADSIVDMGAYEYYALSNEQPVAADDAYSVEEDHVLSAAAPGVLANDMDANGNRLMAILVSSPSNGTLTLLVDGSFVYTPNAGFTGADSFTYKANDGVLDSNVATVTITIRPVNYAPIAVDDAYTVNEHDKLSVPAPGVLGNDSDVEGDPLTATLISMPLYGTLTLNPDGSFTYEPGAEFALTDSFTYVANDGILDSNEATVVITINHAPVAADDTYSVEEDRILQVIYPSVLTNDRDPDRDGLSAVLVAEPSHGALTFGSGGMFVYYPDANFNGQDSFTYVANDGALDSNVATVTITVYSVPDPPVAVDDEYSTTQGSILSVPAPGVLANDTDGDGDQLTAMLLTGHGPAHGTLTLNLDGSFVYTPDGDFTGTDTFEYLASDRVFLSSATATISVNPVNRPPVAVDDAYSTDERETLTVDPPGVLGNDSDPDGDPLTAILMDSPSQGALTFSPDGSFTYEPASSFTGTDTFTYVANDCQLNSNVATVTITVSVDTVPPEILHLKAEPKVLSPPDQRMVVVKLICTVVDDTDPAPSWEVVAVSSSDPESGMFYGDEPGDWEMIPSAPDYVRLRAERAPKGRGRTYTITVEASDASGNTSTATVNVKVAKRGGGKKEPPGKGKPR